MKKTLVDYALKFIIAFGIGYVIGFFFLGKAYGQTKMNQNIVLTTENSTVLRGVIDSESMSTLQTKLVELVNRRAGKDYPIYLVIDSPGGEIFAGLDFIEFAKTIPNLKTISIFSASMASAIVEALPGERLVTQNAFLMFHRAQGGFSGYFENGEVESRLGMAKSIVQFMEKNNASRMQMYLSDYKRLASTELWLFGDNTLLFRAADRTVDIVCSKELLAEFSTTSFAGGFLGLQKLDFVFSACPLFRTPVSQSTNKVRYLVPSFKDYSVSNLVKLN